MNIIKTDLLSNVGFVDHAFFNRHGGVSTGNFESLNVGFKRDDNEDNVIRNREIVAEQFNVSLENLVILNQVHGDKIHVIDENNVSKYKFSSVEQALSNEGDAIITKQKGLLIGVNTADCAPILLCDQNEKMIAVIHAGWKGALGEVIENTVETMKSLGGKTIVAAIGPCIQKRSFAIKKDVANLIDKRYLTNFDNKILFDLPLLILEKLMRLGVKTVSKMGIDTFADENFFSYRRQDGVCGVQFSGIMIKEQNHE